MKNVLATVLGGCAGTRLQPLTTTRPRYLPPSQVWDSQTSWSVLSEGCLLQRCRVDHCVLGLRLRVEEGVVRQDTLVMGAETDESEVDREGIRAAGGVPLGIGAHVSVIDKDRVQEADRQALGFTIRDGIVVIEKNPVLPDGTVI